MKNKDYETSIVMGVPFSKLNFSETITYLVNRIRSGKLTHVVTANPEIVMYADKDNEYMDILKRAEIVVADGIGVVIASKLRGNPVQERVAGYDLLMGLMQHAEQNHWRVFLLGAKEEMNQLAFQRLSEQFPNAKMVGRHHGYFKDNSVEEQAILEEITKVKPDLLFVALGYPRQESWISRHRQQLQTPLMMGVGGSIDVVSGKVKRAPVVWQKVGLEWFYRLITTPSRWRRALVLPHFMVKELKAKLLKK